MKAYLISILPLILYALGSIAFLAGSILQAARLWPK